MTVKKATVRVVSFNNKGYKALIQRLVRKGFVIVARVGPDIVLVQESWLSRYITSFKNSLGKADYAFKTPGPKNLVSGTITARKRSKFEWVRSFDVRLHGANKRSAKRNISGEVVRLRARRDYTIAFCSAHFTPDDDLPAHREGRRNLLAWAKKNARNHDLVIIGTDANTPRKVIENLFGDTLEGKKVKIRTSSTFYGDHIIVIGNNVDVTGAVELRGTASDHDPIMVDLTIHF